MKLFSAITAAAVIGASLITANPAEAQLTSADYWASAYKSKYLDRIHASCAKGREYNAKGWEYIQPIKIQGMNEDIRDYPNEAQEIRAQTAGMLMVMSQVCPRVY
jgi:hypothetical protein